MVPPFIRSCWTALTVIHQLLLLRSLFFHHYLLSDRWMSLEGFRRINVPSSICCLLASAARLAVPACLPSHHPTHLPPACHSLPRHSTVHVRALYWVHVPYQLPLYSLGSRRACQSDVLSFMAPAYVAPALIFCATTHAPKHSVSAKAFLPHPFHLHLPRWQ